MPKAFHGAGSAHLLRVNAAFLLNFALYLAAVKGISKLKVKIIKYFDL